MSKLQVRIFKKDEHVQHGTKQFRFIGDALEHIKGIFEHGIADYASVYQDVSENWHYTEWHFFTAFKKSDSGMVIKKFDRYGFSWSYKKVDVAYGMLIADIYVKLPGTEDVLLTISGYDLPDHFDYEKDGESWVLQHHLGELLEAKKERGLLSC